MFARGKDCRVVEGHGMSDRRISRYDPRFIRTVADVGANPGSPADRDALCRHLLALFQSPEYRPPMLPGAAMELLDYSQRRDADFDEIAHLLEQDQLLAGQLLRICNSPMYARAQPARSLKQALLRLGLKTLRDLAMEVAVGMRVFRGNDYSDAMERLRRHSILTAHLSRMICRHLKLEGEYAFMCGLFHDAGIAGVLIALEEGKFEGGSPDLAPLWPVINSVHQETSGILTRMWRLYPDLVNTVSRHHDIRFDDNQGPLPSVVCIAEQLCNGMGVTVLTEEYLVDDSVGLDHSDRESLFNARSILEIDTDRWQQLEEEAEQIKELFD